MISELTIVFPLAGLLSMIIAWFVYLYIKRQPRGGPLMQELEGMIQEGVMAFFKRECLVLALFAVCAVSALWFFFREWYTPGAFVSGLLSSIIAIFLGVKAATRGNSRTAEAADRSGQARALTISYFSGSTTGLSVTGAGLLGLGAWFWRLGGDPDILRYLIGFAMGASSVALFVRIGGGIFTKAADLGSDLAARIEAGISQDDPRNPGVIADSVGDNVGDIAGMGADIFESYVASIIASIVLGATTAIPGLADQSLVLNDSPVSLKVLYMGLPLVLAVAGQISSFIGIVSMKAFRGKRPAAALRSTVFISDIFFMALAALVIWRMDIPWGILWAVVSGVICGIALGLFSEYSTSGHYISRISQQARSGPATVIISGLAAGMGSTCLPVLAICAAIFTGYWGAGVYGLGIMAVGMLSTAGAMMTIDAYHSIADNAGGISGMSSRRITGSPDATVNTSSAIGRGFASGAAALAAVALFAAYSKISGLQTVSITDPRVIAGIFIGAAIPMLTAAGTMSSVGRAALKVVEEIRRQFREIPGLLSGKDGIKPDTGSCVSIATGAAVKEVIVPGLIAFVCPVAAGILLGTEALAGLILGTAVMGIFLSIFMANAGGAWDNAERYIESGNFGGRGSDNHSAAAVGDTVGGAFKDTSGPAMNTVIKIVAIVSLLIAPFLRPGGLFWELIGSSFF